MKGNISISGALLLFACNNSLNDSATSSDSTEHSARGATENDAASSGGNAMMDMHNAMNDMMQQMHSVKPTGDPDHDFAIMMMYHHQGEIKMAKSEISAGTKEAMKQMAQKMISEQQKEVDQFNQFIQGHQPSGDSDFGKRAMRMMTPMNNIKMENSSLDAMFASMMIPRHQDGVKMAQDI